MKRRIVWGMALAVVMLGAVCRGAEAPESAAPAFLGEKIWTKPGWVKIRATSFPLSGISKSGIKLRYATDHAVGSAAAPYWIPMGSLVRIWANNGHRVYLAVDLGSAVESRKAARKSGKGKAEKANPVIDFCSPRQHWPDRIDAEVFQYVGSVPFDKLTKEQKEQLMAYAGRFILK